MTIENVKIEPCNAVYGNDAYQVEEITAVADVAKSLLDKAFIFFIGSVGHYIYFNINSEGVDPSIAGYTPHAVAASTGATANAIAAAAQAVIDALSGITATVSQNVITITQDAVGYVQPARDVNCGFSFEVTTEGDSAIDVGLVEGDIEIAKDEKFTAITAHQYGTDELGEIKTGQTVEVSMTLSETTKTQLRKMLAKSGSTLTPSGASGTEVIGLGQDKNFMQTITYAKKLVLHPVVLGSSDKSRDMNFWLAFPKIPKLTFSGEKAFNLPITLKVYPDMTKNAKVRYYAYGDGSQTLT